LSHSRKATIEPVDSAVIFNDLITWYHQQIIASHVTEVHNLYETFKIDIKHKQGNNHSEIIREKDGKCATMK